MKARIGVIGGGQLAWMMAPAAEKLGLELVIQTPSLEDPAVSIAKDVIVAAIDDDQATAKLANKCDLITFENEFINLAALKILEEDGVVFRPSVKSLSPLLDKYHQRCYLQELGLPVPKFMANSSEEVEEKIGFPLVVKARRHGYDGQGTFIIKNQAELREITKQLNVPLLLEEFVPFEQELAVIAARSLTGEMVIYPVVETKQKNQVCHWVIAPANVASAVNEQIEEIAKTLLEKLEFVGVVGIELFLTQEGKVLVNEIAPRTHNSGHYTIDACTISQFEMHLRAVTGLPLEQPKLKTEKGAVMVNLLGYEHAHHDYQGKRAQLGAIEHAYVHWYNKTESHPGRKLGHVTVLLAEKYEEERLKSLLRKVEAIWYR